MNPFHELESPIINTAMVAQILAAMFEDAHMDGDPKPGVRLTEHEAEMFSFLIYDLCARTTALRKDFQAAFEASAAERDAREGARHAA